MSQDLFAAALIPWFRDRADEVVDFIHHLALPNDAHPGTDMFRPAQVPNVLVTTNPPPNIPVAAERLIRWDLTHPNDAFWNGFPPWVTPSTGTFTDQAFNLRQYVASNVHSVFVGATRYYRNERRQLVRWQPRVTAANDHRFEYEIFAYGGIDVNHVLGEYHQYANQHEVAFPGGIRREFIRTAREYRGTQLVRIWDNPRFDNTLNPHGHVPPLEALPHPIRGIPVPVIFFTEHDGAVDPDDHDELRRRRAAAVDGDGLMHEDGVVDEDPTLDVTPTPRLSVAAVLHPTTAGRAYFFCGNRYAAIDFTPGSTNDTIAWGPTDIVAHWPSLVKAGFGNVDAILTDPRPAMKEVMYFFCLEKYVRIDIKPGTSDDFIVDGPKVITDGWPSLKEAGFKTIDAVLTNPDNTDQVYFFSGEKYVVVNAHYGSSTDTIARGPYTITDRWASLKSAGFKTVDTCLPNPSNKAEAYFFSGENYVLVKVNPGSVDTIVTGPKLVSTFWPSLRAAAFW